MKYLRYEFAPSTGFTDVLAVCDELVERDFIKRYGDVELNLEKGRYETVLHVASKGMDENNIFRLGSLVGVMEGNQTSMIRKFNKSRREK